MLKYFIFSFAILLLHQQIPFSNAFGAQSLHELNRPYYCSTCFSNTQDQNYHCCFYFFKCCAEARRGGSRSTTPSPGYPGIPSHMTFIVQNRKGRPCDSVDCSITKLASNLCCHVQNTKPSPPHGESDSRVFKPAVNIQVMELDGTDFGYHNGTDQRKTVETGIETSTERATSASGGEIEMNSNPSHANPKTTSSDRNLFIPPSLAVDHVIGDSNHRGDNWMKNGWFTKEILMHQEGEI